LSHNGQRESFLDLGFAIYKVAYHAFYSSWHAFHAWVIVFISSHYVWSFFVIL
jgi:hypothetical protein